MNERKKKQFIKCPNCGEIVNIQGLSGERIEVTCPKCDFKGSFEFSMDEKSVKENGNNRLLGRMITFSTRHPGKTLLIFLVITFLFLIPTSQLTIDSSMGGMLGEDMPDEIQQFVELSELFGEQELVTVVVDATDSDEETAINLIKEQ